MKASIHTIPSRTRALLLALSTMLPLVGFGSTASGETVGLFYDPATPQHVFAAGDIRAALEARKMTVEIKDLSALKNDVAGKKIVIALASDPKVTALFAAQGGRAVKSAGEQAYAVRAHRSRTSATGCSAVMTTVRCMAGCKSQRTSRSKA
jgi:hypothetical protein